MLPTECELELRTHLTEVEGGQDIEETPYKHSIHSEIIRHTITIAQSLHLIGAWATSSSSQDNGDCSEPDIKHVQYSAPPERRARRLIAIA